MDFDAYQNSALKTDRSNKSITPLLGLIGEVGSVASVIKKWHRDKTSTEKLKKELSEELGDVLWYITTLASKYGLNLKEVASENIDKVNAHFGASYSPNFDAVYPESERFPRKLIVSFSLDEKERAVIKVDDSRIGDLLSDNTHESDHYRFHDAFHFAFLAHLGWSPVLRRLLKKKRKSNKATDENEDGARAAIVEEAVVALVFMHAEQNNFTVDRAHISMGLVNLVKNMTSKFEVAKCNNSAWVDAITSGIEIFNELEASGGGLVSIDMDARRIQILEG